jgi:hypothetical protein
MLVVSLGLGLVIAPGPGETASPDLELSRSFGSGSPEVIPAAAFSTNGNDADSHVFNAFFGSVSGTGSGGGCVQAPAYLPHGATVTSVWASVVDNDASHDIHITLHRRANRDLYDVADMAALQSSGQSTSLTTPSDSTISSPEVRHPDYSYYITTCLPTAQTSLYSVRIYYQEALFMDGFESGESWAWSEVGP